MFGKNKYGVIVDRDDYGNRVRYFGKRNINAAPEEQVIRRFGESCYDRTSLEAELDQIADELLRKSKSRLKVKIEITER